MRKIGVTSEKGGVGKSTLAWNLAGALAGGKQGGKPRKRVVLVDEDSRVQTCLEWANAAQGRGERPGFQIVAPDGAQTALEAGADWLVVDSEGRPPLEDLVAMSRALDLVLLPTGTTRPEIVSTIRLWQELQAASAADHVRVVV
ncbi:ParA family protein, partial [Deinococcus sp. RIT780]|uniref:AAA family ATPase n=1 Tax=Deinococcus sp. RIT780 TaxID=2870472 RepID=UPI001C89753D|nr:ParA family protein [Deinococcus sp. RIT780]